MSLKLGLFAADAVGRDVARVIAQHGDRPACLVVDAADRGGHNDAIIAESGVPTDAVLTDRQLADDDTLARLRDLSLDLILLAWWPHLLPPPQLALARLGCLNFHPSLLPHNRGKDPNFWALVEGSPYGVTLHFADEQVDHGDIVFQTELPYGWEDTGATLYAQARTRLVELFEASYDRIRSGDLPRRPQGVAPTPAHTRRELDPASRIDLDAPCTPRSLLDRLRARTFPRHPACWFEDGDTRYEVRVSITRAPRRDGRDG